VSYSEATAFLEALGIDAMKSMAPSLHRMEALCEVLDHPEQKLHAIHITGTNGKTSTARMAASILSATGLSVGTYTSPHLQTIRERVALNGEPITEEEFGDAFDHLHPFLDVVERGLGENLTFFEVLTGMFFLWAAETVDIAVVEVGLGGRWDATNMMDGAVAVITNVGLDHTKMLGDDPVTIAKEKAGIIKPGAAVVTGERKPDVLAVIQEQADAAGVSTARLGHEFEVTMNRLAVGGRYLSMSSAGRAHEDLYVPLHGSHQAVNAAVAVEAVSAFLPPGSLDEEVINEGLGRTMVPGRLESVPSADGPSMVLDVAHNPDGTSALITSLVEAFAFDSVTFVVGILGDKDHRGMFAELSRVPCSIIATEPKTVRSVPITDLEADARALGLECEAIEDVADALKAARDRTSENGLVCVTGSHYVVGEARTALLGPVL
jgi:dihydrofolate synthase / folylpolyglutamate synthase